LSTASHKVLDDNRECSRGLEYLNAIGRTSRVPLFEFRRTDRYVYICTYL